MTVLDALRRPPGALHRNLVLFVPVLVVALFQLPQLVLQGSNPLLASLVSFGLSLVYLVAVPFFQAGLLGMADEALDGGTSLRSFLREGRANYVSMLFAYLLVLAVIFVLVMVRVLGAVSGGMLQFVGGARSACSRSWAWSSFWLTSRRSSSSSSMARRSCSTTVAPSTASDGASGWSIETC